MELRLIAALCLSGLIVLVGGTGLIIAARRARANKRRRRGIKDYGTRRALGRPVND